MAEEITTSTTRIYSGRVINLRVDTVRLENGAITRREIVEHRGAVAMVPVDDRDNVILVRQFRKAVERGLVEIPAGTLEPGEDPLICAQRELQEETGFTADRLERITGFFPCPGYSTEFIHVFLATGLRPAELAGDEDEDIEVIEVPFEDALAMVDKGEICDAKTIVGLLSCAARRAHRRP
ncbi:MAG: NUDIX hydrolase [Chloroflexi bacterium]|nr:NUDIX hydrolase [Chloroflexota bacterium]